MSDNNIWNINNNNNNNNNPNMKNESQWAHFAPLLKSSCYTIMHGFQSISWAIMNIELSTLLKFVCLCITDFISYQRCRHVLTAY